MKYIFLSFFCLIACSPKITKPIEPVTTFYQEQVKKWQIERTKELVSADSWLSLAGLFWLKEVENTFGFNKKNNIIFPEKAGAYIGSFLLESGLVTMKIKEDIPVLLGTEMPKNVVLETDLSGHPTQMKLGTLSWYLLQREDRFAIRLKDEENSSIQDFGQLDYFEIEEDWNIPAQLIPSKKDKTIRLKNVIDMDVSMKLEGYLVFEKEGVKYELEAMDGGPDLYFIIFADETTGVETYGGGRYLYIPRADETGKTFLDFNKAYNPPCAFTDFATCPLPSEKNRLTVEIRAGEKNYEH